MKLFVIGSNVPFARDGVPGVTAVNIITYELMRSLRRLGHDMVLQLVFNPLRRAADLEPAERQALAHLEEHGVVALPPMYPRDYGDTAPRRSWLRPLSKLRGLATGQVRVEDFYPAARLGERMAGRIRASGADAVLTILSPAAVASTYGFRERPKIAYQGDPDFHPTEARIHDWGLFAGANGSRGPRKLLHAPDRLRDRLWVAAFKQAHLRLMREVDVIANNMATDAEFYTRHGHPRAVYIRNLWSDCAVTPPSPRREPVKIIGHAGQLNATGGTYGLRFLLVEVLPRLDDVMAGIPYEVHIFGGGEVVPSLRSRLQHPRLVVRGFVDDYDRELRSSDVFLLLNNAGRYQGAHTRQIIAWSMGLCLVAHANSQGAIPETRHLENALVGSTPEEIARLIRMAATDSALNGRLRHGGRTTYERYFRPQLIAEALSKEFERAACAATS